MIKLFVFIICIVFSTSSRAQSLVINEVLTSNTDLNEDQFGEKEDWIELYNAGATTINLLGYALSDDSLLLQKWILPSDTLAAGQYLLVWASGNNLLVTGAPLHTNFKLDSNGEKLYLSNPSGTSVDSVDIPELPENIAFGRSPNGVGNFAYQQSVTPVAANPVTGFSGVLKAPQFSVESGFFTTAFDLALSTLDLDASIIYTLDGSEPDADNLGGTSYSYRNQYIEEVGQLNGPMLTQSFTSLPYTAPIAIADRTQQPNKISMISSTYHQTPTYFPSFKIYKGTVVKARTVKPGAIPSKVVTRNYFISPLGSNRFSLPVISVSVDENKFWDYENGIYVAGAEFDDWRSDNDDEADGGSYCNYSRSGEEWEVPGNFSYFQGGQEVINQKVGFQINGGWSRDRNIKSLRVYARDEYSKNSLDHNFFNNGYDSFKRLLMRNSGNDCYLTYFRDAFIQRTVKHLNFSTMAYQPAVSFINGEYWGLINVRERYDRFYLNRVFGVPENEIDLLENSGYTVVEGDNSHYSLLEYFLENNTMTSTSNYNYVKTQMDVESFIDYEIAEIFSGNADWPNNNIQYWRKKTTNYVPDAPYGHDGRWRWLMYDMDGGYALQSSNISVNTLNVAMSSSGDWATLLLRKLTDNTSFKHDFINRFADLMNTTFVPSRLIGIMDSMQAVIAPEMQEHISRWNTFSTITKWNDKVTTMRNFANARQAYVRAHIVGKFTLAGTYSAALNVSGTTHGYVHINTIDILASTEGVPSNPYPWSGIYFKGIPVNIKAEPMFGYIFSHWSGSSTSTNPELTLTPTDNINLIAHFVIDPNTAPQPIYFFVFDQDVLNNIPLVTLTPKFQRGSLQGSLEFQSALLGYPSNAADINWRKASMERRNLPTDLNYRATANNNLDYNLANIRGLQIKQPFVGNDGENTMIFHVPTTTYMNIKCYFAAVNEMAAEQLLVDYSVTADPQWIATGLSQTTFNLSNVYQLYTLDWTNITTANSNPNFKIRIRFAGNNLSDDLGNRVTFNNLSIDAVPAPAAISQIITPPSIPTKVYTDAPFSLNATASSGLTVLYSILSGPATLLGSQVSITGVGQVQVLAKQSGDWQYLPAPDVIFNFNVNKATQSITFSSIPVQIATAPTIVLNATSTSGLPITFSVVSGPAIVNLNMLTLTGSGSVTVRASQPGNDNFLVASNKERTFVVAKAPQTISFGVISDQYISSPPILLAATSSSGLAVSYTVISGPATIENANQIHLTGLSGVVVVQADQAGDNFYEPATSLMRSFIVNKFNQVITFDNIANQLPTALPFDVVASSNSGLPVALTLVSGPATLDENTVTLTGAVGTVILRAEQSGNDQYESAIAVEQSFGVGKAAQTITFGSIADKITTDAPFLLSATATSGLGVAFEVVSGPISIVDNTVTLSGVFGTATVKAVQMGDAQYAPADEVVFSFEIIKAAQSISLLPIMDKFTTDAQFPVIAEASSMLDVTFSIVSGPAIITDNVITLEGAPGTVTVLVTQAGNGTYQAAQDATTSFEVLLSNQMIIFQPLANKFTIDAPFTLQAEASSGLGVQYEVVSGPATSSNDTITLAGVVGTVVVQVSQAGNTQYAPALAVAQSFDVILTPQSIDFQAIPDKFSTDLPFALIAQTTSGLPILYEIVTGPASLSVTADSIVLHGMLGDVTVRAIQNGNNQYATAASVEQSFAVVCVDSDEDNDGLCLAVDCDDTNPLVPGLAGTPCDDDNASTINDQLAEDGCTCSGTSSTGGVIDVAAKITYSPNPTLGEVHIRSNIPIQSLEIWTIEGKQLLQKTIGQGGAMYQVIQLDILSQGIYLLRVQLTNGEVKVMKVMKN